jgi:superfamily II DNA or RNA helicase
MIGRGLRTADGKDDCLILDHSDNHIRLAFVTDIHHDELDDGRERQKGRTEEH